MRSIEYKVKGEKLAMEVATEEVENLRAHQKRPLEKVSKVSKDIMDFVQSQEVS